MRTRQVIYIMRERFSNKKSVWKGNEGNYGGNLEDGGLKMVNVIHLLKATLNGLENLQKLEKRNGRIYQDGGFLIWQTVFGGLTSIIALKM